MRGPLALALVAALALAASGLAAPPLDPSPASLRAPHGQVGSFFNPWWPEPGRRLFDFLRWTFSKSAYDKSGPPGVPTVANDGRGLAGVEHSASVTWVGHASFAVHDGDDVLLTDPHFGPRALIRRRHVAPGVPLASIPPDALALISHNHYDHLDAYTVEALPETVAWFVPLGLADWFRDRGRAEVVELDWWESAQRGRWTLTCLPSQHWSRRIEHGTNETLWCSWLADSGDHRYYFAGDTGYFHGFAEYGRRFAPIDVAMLPIGAYEPRWFMHYQHMDPAEAYRAFLDLRARFFLPMHWGTFDLTDEPLDEAPRALARVLADSSAEAAPVVQLAVGERWKLPPR